MTHVHMTAAVVSCLGLGVACSRPDSQENRAAHTDGALPVRVSVTGCLTASGDRFVLTSLLPGDTSEPLARATGRPYPATEVYELEGANQKLRQYVGWQVRVSGEAPPRAIAIVQEHSPVLSASPSTVGTAGQSPSQVDGRERVSTQQQIRFEMTTLRVTSVTAISNLCLGRAR